jgi:hypothetical protein
LRNTWAGLAFDMIIDRKDGIINLLEIKFSEKEFVITKNYEENLRNKIFAFKEENEPHKAVHLVMLASAGIKKNKYYEMLQKELTIKDLFIMT